MTAALWTSTEAAAATGGRATATWAASGVSIDSRSVAAGDLFVALRGPTFDGHDFVPAARKAGAAAAVVAQTPGGVADTAALLMVDDTQTALEALARAARDRATGRLVAITGSVGKTGTKEMLALALTAVAGHRTAVHASRSSHNNQIGVPLSLANLPREATYGVFELGMNHAGEITPLTRLVRPHVAVITTVEATHLGHFDSVEHIADAKAEIFEGMDGQGAAVLYRDNTHFDRLRAAAAARGITRIIGFGESAGCDVRLVGYVSDSRRNRVTVELNGGTIDYDLGIDGRHWAVNSLAVLGAVSALGGDVATAAASLAGMTAPAGRGARHLIDLGDGPLVLIDDSYNASPASMRAAILTLAAAPPGPAGRRIAVLGDMLELGPTEDALHAGLATDLAAAGIDLVFTVGPRMARLHEALSRERRGGHMAASAQIVAPLFAALGAGDVVLVKGSLGSRMGAVVDALIDAGAAPAPRVVNGPG